MGVSKRKALSDFAFLAGGETLSKIAGFIAFVYLARVLKPDAYASVEVAVALLAPFALMIDFGFGPIAARDIIRTPSLTNHYAAVIPGARLILVVLCIPTICTIAYLMGLPRATLELTWVFAFSLLATAWFQLGILQGLDKMSMVSLGQSIRMLTFAMGVILFVQNTDDLLRVGFVEIAAMASMAVYFVAMQKRLFIPLRLCFDIRELVKLTVRSYEIGFGLVIAGLIQYLPTLFMATFAETAEIAWFTAAHRIVISAVSYCHVYHFNLFPIVATQLKESKDAFLRVTIPSYRVSAWGGVFIALVTVLISEPICEFMFGERYLMAGLPLAILIWVLPITLLFGHAHWALIVIQKQRYVLYSQLTGLAMVVVSGLVLIPRYGFIGAAVSMVTGAATIWVVAHYYANRYVAKIPFIRLLIIPALLSLFVLYIHVHFGLTWPGLIIELCVFAALAQFIDRSLVSDFCILLKVKNS